MNLGKIYCSLLLAFFTTFNLSAQNTFQHSYGTTADETPMAFIQTFDKGFAILGSTSSGGLQYLVTDSLGNKIWSKEYPMGTSSDFIPGVIIQTKDSGYLICNSYTSIILKIDPFGNTQWARYFPTSIGISKAIEVPGGYIIGGGYTSIMKIDLSGNIVWVSNTLANYDIVLDVAFSSYDSCFYVFSESGRVTKLNKNGIGIWAKYLYINGIKYQDNYGGSLTAFPNGKLFGLLIGYPDGNQLIAFDTSGTVHWNLASNTYYGFTWAFHSSDNNLLFAMPDSDNYYLSGSTGSSYLFKTDTLGTIKWSRKIGGPKTGTPIKILQTTDNGIAVLASTQNYTAGGDDFYLIKTDSMGKSICNSDTTIINKLSPVTVSLDTCNYPFISGIVPTDSIITLTTNTIKDTSFNACLCYPPHANFYYIQSNGFLLDSSTWVTNWYWSFGNGTYDSIDIYPKLNYKDTGVYTVCLTVKNACGTDSTCQNIDYQLATVGIDNIITPNNKINLYPNPNNGVFNIQISTTVYESKTVDIYNILGEKIYSTNFSGDLMQVILGKQPSGIYLYRIINKNGNLISNGKLVIQ